MGLSLQGTLSRRVCNRCWNFHVAHIPSSFEVVAQSYPFTHIPSSLVAIVQSLARLVTTWELDSSYLSFSLPKDGS